MSWLKGLRNKWSQKTTASDESTIVQWWHFHSYPSYMDKIRPHGSGVAARGALRVSAQSGSRGAMRLKCKISFLHVKVSTSDWYLEVFKPS